ncbi:helix-turn-helix domain-containing protein [Sphingobium sp.]|uniref:AraC family transcriptional regulator n=1 Tax=Sphingobium sp. TaxID=1912891 RepID=UPI003BB63537
MMPKPNGIVPDLCLHRAAKPFDPAARIARRWTGFAVEQIAIDGTEPFSFRRFSDTHYLALHDIVMDEGEMRVDDTAPTAIRDLRDTITYLPSGCAIEGWSAPASRSNSFIALYFDPSMLRDELEVSYETASLAPALHVREKRLSATMRKFKAVLPSATLDGIYAESACLLAAVEILSMARATKIGGLSSRQTHSVLAHIDAHLDQDMGLADLAGLVGLSRFHFGRAFKKTTGQSPYAFIQQRRVEAATLLLSNSKCSIEDVARRCGFRTTANLRRQFLVAKGATPAAFRRALQ